MNGDIRSTSYVTRLLLERGQHFFSPGLLADLLRLEPRQAYRLAQRLEADGLAKKIENGKYLLTGLAPEQVLSNPLFIASHLVDPCYVSYWSALHHHGLTTQVPQTVFCASTRKKQPVAFHGYTFRYVLIKPYKFFGYQREMVGALPVLIADRPKTIVDCLDQPAMPAALAR